MMPDYELMRVNREEALQRASDRWLAASLTRERRAVRQDRRRSTVCPVRSLLRGLRGLPRRAASRLSWIRRPDIRKA